MSAGERRTSLLRIREYSDELSNPIGKLLAPPTPEQLSFGVSIRSLDQWSGPDR